MYISQHAKGHNTLFPTRGEREKTTFLLSSSLLLVLFFLSSLVSSSFFARLIENRKCISSRIIIPSFREGFFSPSFNKTSLMRETRNRERNYDSQSVSLPRRRRRRRGEYYCTNANRLSFASFEEGCVVVVVVVVDARETNSDVVFCIDLYRDLLCVITVR